MNLDPRVSPPVSTSESDFVDVVDLLGYIWKAKLWILGGIIVGLIGAYWASTVKHPPQFMTRVPVLIAVFEDHSPGVASGKFAKRCQ